MSEVPPLAASLQQAPGRTGLKSETIQDAVIRLAGDSQDGIQTVGGMLARLAGRTDQEVITYMTIPATISGGASIYQVRLGSGEVLSPGDRADFLVAFYQHSYDSHIESLREGGVCLYDSDHVTPNLEDKRFTLVGVPMTSATVEAIGGATKDRGKNMFAMGILCSVFDLHREKLSEIIAKQFGGKDESILRSAMLAFDAGYAYPLGDILNLTYHLQPGHERGTRLTTDGNTIMTQGLIAAGVRFGAGYPITPWSPIMEQLRAELPRYGGTFVQAEDELGAISIALGMAYAGHLAITGSSGPGLSLKMEALGWATMAELPLIVINVQRGGPSTGLPTSVEQSDLMQAIYGSHGDTPRVVLAPKNVEDCFYIALEAVRIAKKYSVPVIILSDQALSSRVEAFPMPDLESIVQEPTVDLTPVGAEFKPYPLDGLTKHVAPGTRVEGGGKYPVVTGLEHDEYGHPTASPGLHTKMTARRRNKLRELEAELEVPEIYGDTSGEILLIGWGSTWGPIRESVNRLRSQDRTAGAIHLRHLHPMPPGIGDIIDHYQHVAVVEMNDQGIYGNGQLATLLRARFCKAKIRSICKTDGLTYKIREIMDGVNQITGSTTWIPLKASTLTSKIPLKIADLTPPSKD